MEIVTLGDIHGRPNWRKHILAHPDADKYIFIGDYADSFYLSNVEILHNFKEIIQFKKDNPDKVILLLGNHDVHYFIPYTECDGYRPEARPDLEQLFRENLNLFQIAYQHGKYIWTHAGITQKYYDHYLTQFQEPDYRYYDFTKDLPDIASVCNFVFEANTYTKAFHLVGYSSKGSSPVPSLMWARPKDHRADPFKGYVQIVGHTQRDSLTVEIIGDAEYIYVDLLSTSDQVHVLTLN